MTDVATAGGRLPEIPVDDLLENLRDAWSEACLGATGTDALGAWLSARLDDLRRVGRVDRAGLLAVLDEVGSAAREAGREDLEHTLGRHLLRAVYEFLLAVDARHDRVAAGLPPIEQLEEPHRHSARVLPLPQIARPAPAADAPRVDLDPAPAPVALSLDAAAPGAVADGPGADPTAAEPAAAVDPSTQGCDILPEPVPAVAMECGHLLSAGRHRDAAALLRRAAAEHPSEAMIRLAIATGDRCRAAGRRRAATECYEAAWNADRLSDPPLWRLADIALDDGDRALARSWLERLATVLAWRGDSRGAARAERKLAVLGAEPVAAAGRG